MEGFLRRDFGGGIFEEGFWWRDSGGGILVGGEREYYPNNIHFNFI